MFTFACFVIAFVTMTLLYDWYKRPQNFPPGPRGFPLLGKILSVGKYPERRFAKWSKIYGAIMSVRLGRQDWIILNDLKSIKQAFVVKRGVFSGRPKMPFFDQIREKEGILLADYGGLWRKQRKFALTTIMACSDGRQNLEETILVEASHLVEVMRLANGKPFPITVYMRKATANVICSVLLGKRFDYDDVKHQQLLERIFQYFTDPVKSSLVRLSMFAPGLLKVFPFNFFNHGILQDLEYVMENVRGMINNSETDFNEKYPRGYIDSFLMNLKENQNHFSFDQLARSIFDLIIAGTETSSTCLLWSFLCLLHYPQAQRKLRKEIEDVIGLSRTVKMSHNAKMPYANAFIQEILRYRTVEPLGVPHKTTDDVTLNGHFIPKNTNILSNIWAVHNDSDVWDEPEKFKPERFLDENGDFIQSKDIIPFSIGPRYCLGRNLPGWRFSSSSSPLCRNLKSYLRLMMEYYLILRMAPMDWRLHQRPIA
ncbi:unnamed protein product [Clavelina lepadiformis]|uniref:Cytochrome P450 n=1 Tax=Clavelina lepadiformis TaxID=159417 RepID=A0ABP0FLM5_CLALP